MQRELVCAFICACACARVRVRVRVCVCVRVVYIYIYVCVCVCVCEWVGGLVNENKIHEFIATLSRRSADAQYSWCESGKHPMQSVPCQRAPRLRHTHKSANPNFMCISIHIHVRTYARARSHSADATHSQLCMQAQVYTDAITSLGS